MTAASMSRLLVVVLLVGCAVMAGVSWTYLWSGASTPGTFFGGDHEAYRAGADRLLGTGMPYHSALAAGPIANHVDNVPIAYLYPPPLAQAFVVLRLVDPVWLAWLAAGVQLVAVLALTPRIYRRFGGGSSAAEVLAVWLLVLSSFPLHFALFGGNLSGWLTIAVAVMLISPKRWAGVAAALAALAKFTPLALVAPAIVYGPTRIAAIATLTGVSIASIALDLQAWASWISVLPSILRFPTGDSLTNFAPAALMSIVGLGSVGAAAGYGAAVVAGLLSLWLAQRARWAGAVAAGVAAILYGSGSTWDHYLAPTLPLVIAAVPNASWRSRGVLAAFVFMGLVMWNRGASFTDAARVLFLAIAAATSITTIAVLSRIRAPDQEKKGPAGESGRDLAQFVAWWPRRVGNGAYPHRRGEP